jgi:hypothetical protein
LNKLYTSSSNLNNSKDYYTDRQDNYTSVLASQLSNRSNLESKSVSKYLNYNFGINSPASKLSSFNSLTNNYNENYHSDLENSSRLRSNLALISDSNNGYNSSTDAASYNINNTTDGKFHNNAVKLLLSSANNRKSAIDTSTTSVDLNSSTNASSVISSKFSNVESNSKFKDLKSPNLGFLSSDKNSRLVAKMHTSKGQFNLSDKNSNLADIMSHINTDGSSSSELAIYNSSNND